MRKLLYVPFGLFHKRLTRQNNCNFGVVTEGKMYRSGKPTKWLWAELQQRQILLKTIVVFNPTVSEEEELYIWARGGEIIRLPFESTRPPRDDEIAAFLNIGRTPARLPALFRCRYGADRTGLMVAIWRIVEEHWDVEAAIAEMRRHHHLPWFNPLPSRYLRANWRRLRRQFA